MTAQDKDKFATYYRDGTMDWTTRRIATTLTPLAGSRARGLAIRRVGIGTPTCKAIRLTIAIELKLAKPVSITPVCGYEDVIFSSH